MRNSGLWSHWSEGRTSVETISIFGIFSRTVEVGIRDEFNLDKDENLFWGGGSLTFDGLLPDKEDTCWLEETIMF